MSVCGLSTHREREREREMEEERLAPLVSFPPFSALPSAVVAPLVFFMFYMSYDHVPCVAETGGGEREPLRKRGRRRERERERDLEASVCRFFAVRAVQCSVVSA